MPDILPSIDNRNSNLALREYASILFKIGNTYYARKHDGSLIASVRGNNAEVVIQAALDQQGTVYFADSGDNNYWLCSNSFTGFNVSTNTHIIFDTGPGRAYITVPTGFTGIAFKYSALNYFENVSIRGLSMYENGTASRNWTGIKFETSAKSLSYCHFKDITIHDAYVGIELETSNSRWIESNHFENIQLIQCRTGMLFDQQSGTIHRNLFEKVVCNAITQSFATHGFKDIDGNGNIFLGCDCWDFVTSNMEANIKSTAQWTMIIGGQMTGWLGHFVDQGFKTMIVDSGRSNANNSVITRPDFAKYGTFSAAGATAGEGLLNGILANVTVGTGAGSRTFDSTGLYRTYDTGGTVNSIFGLYGNQTHMNRINNPFFKTAIYLNNNTNMRVFAGFVASAVAPASAADPLNGLEGVGLWFDSGVSANWKRMHNDNSGASVVDDTGVTAATATLYPLDIYGIWDGIFRFVFNGTSTDITTDIPASTTGLSFRVYLENTAAASKTMRHYYLTVRNDK